MDFVSKIFLPGMGLSSAIYNMLDLKDDVSCIDIDHMLPFDKTIQAISNSITSDSILIGYSLGARLAANIALQPNNKIKGLVLISFNAGINNDDERTERQSQDKKMAKLARQDLNEMYRKFDTNSVFDMEIIDKDLRIQDRNIVSWQLEELGLGSSPYLEDKLLSLKIPVMYITGTRDTKYVELNKRYKKKTAFSFHFNLDSDHRVPMNTPISLSRCIDWFSENVVYM